MTLSKHKKIVPDIPVRGNQVKQYCRMDLPALESDDSEKVSPAAPVSVGNTDEWQLAAGTVHTFNGLEENGSESENPRREVILLNGWFVIYAPWW